MSEEPVYKVKPLLNSILGGISTLFFLFCTVVSFFNERPSLSIFFLLFSAFGVFVLLTAGVLTMSREEITSATPIAKYKMRWEEVKRIELDPKGGNLVFYGESSDRRVAVLGPLYWYGTTKHNLSRLLSEQTQKYKIPITRTSRVIYTLSRNTKEK